MNPLSVGQQITGIVEKLVFSGLGLIRHDGLVIFVENVIPGEKVLVEITSNTSSYSHAKLIQGLEPSCKRVLPVCPHFKTCGGCQLQHIDYPSQVDIKKQMLQEALFNLYDADVPFFPSVHNLAWRRKITLHARNGAIGFYSKNSQKLIPIKICPIFSKDRRPIDLAKGFLACLSDRSIDITLFHLGEQLAFSLCGNPVLSEKERKDLHDYAKSHSILFANLGDWTFSCFEKTWHFSPESFIQNHLSMCQKLWGNIVETVSSLQKGGTVLDLYSGIGVTAIELACRGYEVHAVEYSKEAITCALKTWESIPHSGNFFAHNSSVEKFLSHWKKPAGCIIVNPPRSGLSKQALQSLCKIPCHNLIYVSCSPATLVRDLRTLVKNGMKVTSVVGFDLFPQTTHFETIVTLENWLWI